MLTVNLAGLNSSSLGRVGSLAVQEQPMHGQQVGILPGGREWKRKLL